MRIDVAIAALLFLTDPSVAQRHKSQEPIPNEIVLGRDSFIDVGPPFNYYYLTFLHSEGDKTDVERISLTPPSDSCYPRAEIRVVHLTLKETLSHVLEGINPCVIPEKKLKAELKRRTKGPVFSGMDVSMQVESSGRTRIIRADILDRDIFDEHPNTPQYTAWSRALYDKLNQVTGDHPWDNPIFPVSDATPEAVPASQSRALQAVADGKFDQIFGDTPDRPSVLYHLAHVIPHQPSIELSSIGPDRPTTYVDPVYPPIAKAARVQGTVDFHLTVGARGFAANVAIDAGPLMLRQAVTEAIAKWKFSPDDSGKAIHGSLRFELNCAAAPK
jgi:hypothetical protein